MQINFKNDIERLSRDLEKIKASAIPKATQQAINKTIVGVKSDTVKSLSNQTSVKQKEIREQVRVTKATKNNPQAKINAYKAKARNLINFVTASQRKPNLFNKKFRNGNYKAKGVKARAWGNRKEYKGSFIGTGKNGATLVFARTGKGRTPLKALNGPSVRTEFDRPSNQSMMKANAKKRFEVELKRSLNLQLRNAVGFR